MATRPTPRTALVLWFIGWLVSGCASMTVVDTQVLPADKLEPLGSETISSGGYRLTALSSPDELSDVLIVVAMSGGGKRSAAFAYGTLKGMRDVTISTPRGPEPLLNHLSGITGVSGGSFTAAYYGLHRDKTFGKYEKDFLYSDTNSYIFGIYLLPWNWTWLADPIVGTNDFMEKVYDSTMFHGATFKDLGARGRPLIGIGATDISYGTPFMFTQEMFDILCSDLDVFPVSRAVAASNGFPGLFSPITLTNHADKCGGRRPGWERRVTEAERRDTFSRLGMQANNLDRYLDTRRTTYVHLADGGIADNLSLRVVGGMMQNVAQSPDAIAFMGYGRVRRILVLSIDGQGAQDSSVAQRQMVGGIFELFGLVSGAQIDRYNFETLTTVQQQIALIVQAIRNARCARAPMIDGRPCNDVRGDLLHISLAAMPPGPEKDKLLAIPTGLTIPAPDVDLLVDAGRNAIVSSDSLRSFLLDYAIPTSATAINGLSSLRRRGPRS